MLFRGTYGTTKPPLGRRPRDSYLQDYQVKGMWLFNEGGGGLANDLSGYGNYGTLTNMAAPPTATSGWNPGIHGGALAFDGTNDRVIKLDNAITMPAGNFFTISMWINPAVLGNIPISWNFYDWGGSFLMDNAASYGICIGTAANYTLYGSAKYGTIWDIGLWNHTAFGYNGSSTLFLFKNAVLQTRVGSSASLSYTYSNHANTSAFSIGCRIHLDNPINFCNCSISDVRIHSIVLTPDQIEREYQEPYGMFDKPVVYFIPAAGVVNAPTGGIYGPLHGPFAGPI